MGHVEREQPARPIDVNAALDRLGGDHDFFVDLLKTLQQEADSELVEIEEAIQRGDAESVGRFAHSLKGAAASMAAEPMRAAAHELERIGEQGRLADALPALSTLRSAVHEFTAFVVQYLE
jgi:HPt (histidine-containing phosphotransfer) domain-containing protein